MSFNDIVKGKLKTKSEIAEEKEQSERDALNAKIIASAKFNYEAIKNEILNKAQTGQAENGIISGIYRIPIGSSYDDDIPYSEGFFDCDWDFGGRKHDWFIVAWQNHVTSLKIKNISNIKAMFDAMNSFANADDIELVSIFLYSVVRDGKKDRIIRTKRYPIQKRGSVEYKTSFNGRQGESGFIFPAIEYRFRIK